MLLRWLSLTQEQQTDAEIKEKLMAVFKQCPGINDPLMSYFMQEPMPDW